MAEVNQAETFTRFMQILSEWRQSALEQEESGHYFFREVDLVGLDVRDARLLGQFVEKFLPGFVQVGVMLDLKEYSGAGFRLAIGYPSIA